MINRRNFISAAATFAAAAATSRFVFAEDKSHKGHTHPKSTATPELKSLAAVAAACSSKGEACLQHCLEMLTHGDTSMADCAKSVREMMVYCNALSQAATQGSKHIKQLAKIAAEACAECEKECRKHADQNATCRECADSCAECLKQCKSISV